MVNDERKDGETSGEEKGGDEGSLQNPWPPEGDPHPPPVGGLYALSGASTALGLALVGVALSGDCLQALLLILGLANLGIGLLGLKLVGRVRNLFARLPARRKLAGA